MVDSNRRGAEGVMDKVQIDKITDKIIGAAIEVHKTLGPGLLESAYQKALVHELKLRDMAIKEQVPVPLEYKGVSLDCAYRLDILVDDQIIIELKAVEALFPIHEAQAITYLKLTGKKVCLIINFNNRFIKDGIKRIVNNL
jgi:GxxExxY protein